MPFLARLSLRSRVAVLSCLVSVTTLGLLGWWYVCNAEDAFTRAATVQAEVFAQQAAPSIAQLLASDGHGTLPAAQDGLTGAAVFDPDGTPTGATGEDTELVPTLSADVRRAVSTGKPVQHLQAPDGRRWQGLHVRDGEDTLLVTVVPHGGGAVATLVHVSWALDELHQVAVVTILGLALGALILTLALVVVIGRYVTRPVERLAETDPLTGVANQRAFSEAIAAAMVEVKSTGTPLSLIAIDIDGLKLVNDEQGHLAGDRLITDVAGAARGAVRAGDLLARVGGDEFVILCPGLDHTGALEIAARIEAALEADDLFASLGVAELPPGGSATDLRERADTALYAAKARRKTLRLV